MAADLGVRGLSSAELGQVPPDAGASPRTGGGQLESVHDLEQRDGIDDAADADAPNVQDDSSQECLVPEEDERLEPVLANLSILAHLAFFSILGVVIRYSMEILFGPHVAHVTDDSQSLFLDLPANIFGCFLMGIVGVVSKRDIAVFSEPLAIGLSTGLCGTITTYASWNQRMLAIIAEGFWVRGIFGYFVGTAVTYYALIVGADLADGIRLTVRQHNEVQAAKGRRPWHPQPEHYQRRWVSLLIFVGLTILGFIVAGLIFALEPASATIRKAALGCLVAPFGCWLRWYLSWLNGMGVGKEQRWKWVPLGTFAANQLAVVLEACTSVIDAVHNNATGSLLLGGLQLGFMGALSTVSTLMMEVYLLSRAKAARWRAYVYLYLITFLPSLVLGILIYCVPAWVLNVAEYGYNKV